MKTRDQWLASVAAIIVALAVIVSGQITITPTPFFSGTGVANGPIYSDTLCLNAANRDVCLERDAANTFGQRRTTNAQAYKVYSTWTDASNYERMSVEASAAGRFAVLVEQAGTGVARQLIVGTTGAAALTFRTNFVDRFNVAATDSQISGAGTVPALSACGDGVPATGSNSTSGRINSAATMTACTVTFAAATAPNSSDCFISNLVAARGWVSASSNAAFTVTGLTAGDDFMYFCFFR